MFKTNLTTQLLFSGSAWLEAWQQIPLPPPKRYDMPPQGAAGEAVITLQWAAEWLLYTVKIAQKRDAGELSPDQFMQLFQSGPIWKELGSDEAIATAAELPEKYRAVLDYLLYVRGQIRGAYRGSRAGTATAAWSSSAPAGEQPEGILEDWFGLSPVAGPVVVGAVQWVWPVVIVGIAGIAAGAWYGSEVAQAGVAIEATRAAAMAQAMRDIKIAQLQVASGQPITLPGHIRAGAMMEAAQSSPWLIGGVGAAGGAAAVGGAVYGMRRPRRSNPSLGRVKTCVGVPVEVRKYASGFKAWIIRNGKRTTPINVSDAKTYEEAFGKACYRLRKATKAKPRKTKATKKRATKRKSAAKRKTTKRRKKRNPKKVAKRKTVKKRNPNKAAKRKTVKKRNPKKAAKLKTNPRKKRKASKKRASSSSSKAAFVRKQRRSGRSEKQAQSDWKAKRRLGAMRRAA